MNPHKDLLYKDMELVKSPELKKFAIAALDAAPAEFWTRPASSSGRYHPEDNNQEGGLVHHTRKCIYFAREFARALMLDKGDNLDIFTIAAALHDVAKDGTKLIRYGKYGAADWRDHGIYVRAFVEKEVIPADKTIADVYPGSAEQINKILELVASHMGQWTANQNYVPKTMEAWCLHLADYSASRKLVVISDIVHSV